MPAAFQGTHLRPQGDPILDMTPASPMTRAEQRDQIDALTALNADGVNGMIAPLADDGITFPPPDDVASSACHSPSTT